MNKYIQRVFDVDIKLAEMRDEDLDKPSENKPIHPKKLAMRKSMLADVTPWIYQKREKREFMPNMNKQQAIGILEAFQQGFFEGDESKEMVWAYIAPDYAAIKETATQ